MERLQKVIASAGITSRRKAEELILQGRVRVNGKVVKEMGCKVSGSDKVEVDDIQITKEEHVYFLLYKPTGVLSSVSDDKGRAVVTDFFPHVKERIFPVGRLDWDTSGVLILTNDGEFSNQIIHPRYGVNKVYVAKVKGVPTREALRKLEKGIMLEDGKTAPAVVKFLSSNKEKNTAIVQLTIHEGRNRQVRRMFEAIGHEVLKLKRERFGFLGLEGLAPGDSRTLTIHEVKKLYAEATSKDK